PAGLSSPHKVVHLASGDVVIPEGRIVRGPAAERPVELDHRRPEEYPPVGLGGTVGIQLDEVPVRPLRYLDPGLEPQVHPSDAGRLAGLDAPVLDMRQQAPLAVAPVQKQWPLDEHEAPGRLRGGPYVGPPIVGARSTGIVARIVDAVDLAGLGGAGGR